MIIKRSAISLAIFKDGSFLFSADLSVISFICLFSKRDEVPAIGCSLIESAFKTVHSSKLSFSFKTLRT